MLTISAVLDVSTKMDREHVCKQDFISIICRWNSDVKHLIINGLGIPHCAYILRGQRETLSVAGIWLLTIVKPQLGLFLQINPNDKTRWN